ncbi:MAG: glycosyltransferase family 4 protein [Hyphomicrobium sp.]
MMSKNAAILFEPEAYVLDGPKLMGRQSAGNAFLRAAVGGRSGEVLAAYTPRRASADAFARMVHGIDGAAQTRWIPAGRLDLLAATGTLYTPGPVLADVARLRLRAGPAAYSLTGVTHTTASHLAMDAIADLATAPVMPWDALICTSRSVRATVETIVGAERAFLDWRFGATLTVELPQLPVIPLGVHCADFQFSDAERRAGRKALGLEADEVAAIFVGRLSFHAKAHPHAMYVGLEDAARRTGKKLALIQCGWFANEAIEKAFRDGAKAHMPSVRSLFVDGREADKRSAAWAGADLFVSLSDNIQETFGLAPVEAMAAGLPVVATDWDGYRDTIRDGRDGFLVPTTMLPPGLGETMAAAHECGELTYDQYCALACRTVSVDMATLAARLTDLVNSPDLRRSLGASGRARARTEFDWSVVYRRYQELWADLARRRTAAAADSAWMARLAAAPRAAPSRLDPARSFADYATRVLGPDTSIRVADGATADRFRTLSGDALFAYLPESLPAVDMVASILQALDRGSDTPARLAATLGQRLDHVLLALAVIGKMGLVSFAGDRSG